MTDRPTSTCSVASADSRLPQDGPDTEPSAFAKSTPSVSESSASTGQMSLFGETCESSRVIPSRLSFPTPTGSDGTRDGKAYRKDTNMFEGGSHSVQLAHLAAHGLLTSSPQAIPASHSLSPGSDWARKMTATSGRKLLGYLANSGPAGSSVRTLLDTSTWGSTTCYLTWKRSATPQGRLLFRLVPSTPRTGETGFGLWGTPQERTYKDTPGANVPENGYLARQVYNAERMLPSPMPSDVMGGRTTKGKDRQNETGLRLAAMLPTPRYEGFDVGGHRGTPDSLHAVAKMWPTPRASENELRTTKPAPSHGNGHGRVLAGEVGQTNGMKLNSAWVSRMMGYPDNWLTLDGEVTP